MNFGYKFLEKKRFGLGINTGIQYSVLIQSNEPTIKLEGSPGEDVTVIRMVPERMQNNWIFTAGIKMSYRLNDRVVFTLEPQYSRYLNNVYRSNPGWEGKNPYTIGIRTGLELNFK